MGYEYMVKSWVANDDGEYYQKTVYSGQNMLLAVWVVLVERCKNVGCITFEWRPPVKRKQKKAGM